ncbi:MAG: glycoside hydrolase family 99-like domain-containing protein [bacterium]
MKPLVSIISLAYNHEEYLEQALNSIIMQETNFDFEIIIHDDASTDRTRNIIHEYIDKYPKLFKPIFQTENQKSKGTGIVTRTVFNAAKGKYIAFCEGDDYWTDPLKLQKQVDFLEANSGFSGCFHETQQIFEDGKVGKVYGREANEILTTEDTFAALSPFHTSSLVFCNNLGELPGWFSKIVSGDMALFSIISSLGPLKKFHEIMSVYRKLESGITNNEKIVKYHHHLRINLITYLNKFHNYKYEAKAKKIINFHLDRISKMNLPKYDENVDYIELIKPKSHYKHKENSSVEKKTSEEMIHKPMNEKNKIVIIQGGFPSVSATFILDQITGLIDRGFEIENWATYNTGTNIIHDDIEKYDLLSKTKYVAPPNENFKADPKKWLQIFFQKNNIKDLDDVGAFHVHYGVNFNIFEPLFRLSNKFVLVSFHGYDASRYFMQKGDNCYAYLFERADKITTPSHFMKNELVKRGCDPGKITIHRYGIDLEKFVYKERIFNKEKIIFLTVGRFVEKKGIEYSLQAFAKIHKQINAEYRIIGEGDLYDKYMEIIKREELNDSIKFLGPKTKLEVIEEMQKADVFVLTSVVAKDGDSEGVPVALTEAHAIGLPVVSSYHVGIPELVINGETGLLADEKDVDTIANNMLSIAQNINKRESFSKNAVLRVQDEFDIVKLNDKLFSIINNGKTQKDKLNKLINLLENKNWKYKYSLYADKISDFETIRSFDKPAISVIVISWRLHPDNLKSFQILDNQRNQNFELIFVDNGGKDGEFDELKPYVDTYVKLNTNTGAYLARNIGSLFAKSPILFFLEDDGIPESNLIESHIQARNKFDVIAVRGVYLPKTNNPLNSVVKHYYYGDRPFPRYSNLEGNTSYNADVFFHAGGWDDNIVFGHGGIDLSYRLLKIEPDMRKQIYFPASVIYHDYVKDESHLANKKEKQDKSWEYLRQKHEPDFDNFLGLWGKFTGKENTLILKIENPQISFRNEPTSAGVICPICNSQYSHFQSAGIKPRPNALCRECGSLERHRTLWLYLSRKTNFFKDKIKLLDIAPSKCLSGIFKKLPNVEYMSIDLNSPLAMRHMDITSLDFPDDSFDCIICYHVLEHIPDDRKAMRELRRVLKPGGWAILQVPMTGLAKTLEDPSITSPEKRKEIFGQEDHVRSYGLDYKDRLEEAGFNVSVDKFASELPIAEIKRYALHKGDIYYCSKEAVISNNSRNFTLAFAVTEVGPDASAGDYFTALELGTALKEIYGWDIKWLPKAKWYDVRNVDVLIAMTDHYDLNKLGSSAANIVKICWMRNWFERWASKPFFKLWDIHLCSSNIALEYIRSNYQVNPYLLRIATNHQIFKPGSIDKIYDYCFTGSYWNVPRDIEKINPDKLGMNFALFGKNWENHDVFRKYYKGFAPYHLLPDIYNQTKILIDDANSVTKEWGSVNSRVFDALACGTLVITNSEKSSNEVFNGQLPVYHSPEELGSILNRFLKNPSRYKKTISSLRELVLQKHTYEIRGQEFVEILGNYLQRLNIGNLDEVDNSNQSVAKLDYESSLIHSTISENHNNSKQVSIVIPVFNQLDYTRKCIDCIFKNTKPGFELIIVDNGSTDGTFEYLSSLGDKIRLIRNEKNLGFAKANNLGVNAAVNPYILFLNNDTEVQPGWLEPLLEIAGSDNNIGAVGSKLLFPDGRLQHAGVVIIEQRNKISLLPRHVFMGENPSIVPINHPMYFQAVTAACMLVNKNDFHAVGGFDEAYWNGSEDVDFCFKLQRAGKNIVYQPTSIVIHHESKSGKERIVAQPQNNKRLQETWSDFIKPDLIDHGTFLEVGPSEKISAYDAVGNSYDKTLYMEKVILWWKLYNTPRKNQAPTVIIPVYNAYDEIEKCFNSLIENTHEAYNVIIIDDCSTDKRIWPMLIKYAQRFTNITCMRHSENRGYTATINEGCRSCRGDVVLLNSDTQVTSNWLKKLKRTAYSKSNVATVTPLSNAAGVFSIPWRDKNNEIPVGWTTEQFGQVVESLSPGLCPEVPTGNGFCMYITRKALDTAGFFDEKTFPKGYGEENDFCMRALAHGMINLIEDSTFIYHKRSASFKEKKEEIIKLSQKKLTEKHPNYVKSVKKWLDNDPVDIIRESLKAYLKTHSADGHRIQHEGIVHFDRQDKTNKGVQRILFVNHNLYPFENSGTPISTLNHALGMKENGLEVAVLIPSTKVKEGFAKQVEDNFILYKLPRLDKYAVFIGEIDKSVLEKYFSSVEKIIEDFSPDIVQINDYVYMPEEIVSLFHNKGARVIRNVCNLEEICHMDYPVISNGLQGELCSGPESPMKCAECFLINRAGKKREEIEQNLLNEIANRIKRRTESVQKLYSDSVDGVIFTEKAFKDYFTRFINIDGRKTVVNPRGIKFDFEKNNSPRKFDSEEIRFAFIGNIMFSKGPDVILNAFTEITFLENFRLDIYGSIVDKAYKGWIEQLEALYPDKIKYHGSFKKEELEKITSSIDVAIIPSYFDTYNRVVRELLYLGVPIIVTDFFGSSIIQNSVNGLKINVGDYKALAAAMQKIIDNPQLIHGLSRGIAETKIPSLADEISGMIGFYNKLVVKNIPAAPSHTVEKNLSKWSRYKWEKGGDEWSSVWGSTENLWQNTIFSRIKNLLPAESILEIAPGFGRCTQYLLPYCSKYVGIDLTPKCIDACKERFKDYSYADFYTNDGLSLAMVEDDSVDFVFSWDSFVHIQAEVAREYLKQISDKLKKGGYGFIHHSNIGSFMDGNGQLKVENQHWRAPNMSAALFRGFCEEVGLQCITQEIIAWGGKIYNDCFSFFNKPESVAFDCNTKIIENNKFMQEASPSYQGNVDKSKNYSLNKLSNALSCDTKLIAFYLPQYHPIPENDRWWGKGFTEWTNVAKSQPLFQGHYQPHMPADLGFYDLRLLETQKQQAELAKEHGVHGFCYYHYWFNGKRLLETPLTNILKSGKPDFPFCLCWANEDWTRAWDGKSGEILIAQNYSEEDDIQHIRFLSEIFKDKRYIRINGKPLFLVYKASRIPDPLKTTSTWRREARLLGIGEIYLCRVESFKSEKTDPFSLGFDAAVEFQPDWSELGTPILKTENFKAYDYKNVVEKMLNKPVPAYKRFSCVTPSWDNSPRRKNNVAILHNSTPEKFQYWIQEVIKRQSTVRTGENLIFINAWNEWGEGAHLEPDMKFGNAYLEAAKQALHESGKSNDQINHEPNLSSNVESEQIIVSIIMPVWNKVELTSQCIEALLKNTPMLNCEVIIVDNNSTDGTKEFLKKLETRFKIIYNAGNEGFSKACNRGAKAASGKYLVFLNNDTLPQENWLDELVGFIDADDSTGVIGCKLLYPDDTIQHCGVSMRYDKKFFRHHYKFLHKDHPLVNEVREYDAVTAACFITPKKLFIELGMFDEEFLNGCEDMDYCTRVRENGFKIYYTPTAVLYHLESQTPREINMNDRNFERYIQKWGADKMQNEIEIYAEDGFWERDGNKFVKQNNPLFAGWIEELKVAASRLDKNAIDKLSKIIKRIYPIDEWFKNHNVIQKEIVPKNYNDPDKTKILFVLHDFPPYRSAGAQLFALSLAKQINSTGKAEVEIIYPVFRDSSMNNYSIHKSEYEGITIYELHKAKVNEMSKLLDEKVYTAFDGFLKENKYDLIHIHGLGQLTMAPIFAAENNAVKMVMTLHDFWFLCDHWHLVRNNQDMCAGPESNEKCALCYLQDNRIVNSKENLEELQKYHQMRKQIFTEAYSRVNRFFSPSAYLKSIFNNYGFNNIEVLSNGLDCEIPETDHVKNNSGKIIFGYAGQLIIRKGVDLLIATFKSIKTDADIELHIYGPLKSNGYCDKLKSMIDSDDRIKYFGGYNRDEVNRIIQSFDVIVMPSLMDNYPIVVQEAFVNKTPVIASNVGGIPELVTNMSTGILVKPGSIDELTDAMELVINKKEILEKFKTNIPSVKSMNESATEYVSEYEKLICENASISNYEGHLTVQFYVYKSVHWPMFEELYNYLKKQPQVKEIVICLPNIPNLIVGGSYDLIDKLMNLGERVIAHPQDANADVTFIADTIAGKVYGCGKIVNVGHGTISKGYYFTESFWTERENWVDLLCVPGDYAANQFNQILKTRVVPTGMPKLDPVFRGDYSREGLCRLLNLNFNKKIVLYAPTFNIDLSSLYNFVDKFHLLDNQNFYVLIKLHGSTQPELIQKYREIAGPAKNIIFIEDTNLARYIGGADIMISDVSSAFMEFMAMDKPVILYDNPNVKNYHGYDPNNIEYAWRDLGTRVSSFDQMLKELKRILKNGDGKSEVRNNYARQLFADLNGSASENVWKETLSLLDQKNIELPVLSIVMMLNSHNIIFVRRLVHFIKFYSVMPIEFVIVKSNDKPSNDLIEELKNSGEYYSLNIIDLNNVSDPILSGIRNSTGNYIGVIEEGVNLYKNFDYITYKSFLLNPDINVFTGLTDSNNPQIDYKNYIPADDNNKNERFAYEFINKYQCKETSKLAKISSVPALLFIRRSAFDFTKFNSYLEFFAHLSANQDIYASLSLFYTQTNKNLKDEVTQVWDYRFLVKPEERTKLIQKIISRAFYPELFELLLEDIVRLNIKIKEFVMIAAQSVADRFYDSSYKQKVLDVLKEDNLLSPILKREIDIINRLNKSRLNRSTLDKESDSLKILFYFYKNVHIPILSPIYYHLKQNYPDVKIAFGFMRYAPAIRAGFTDDELIVLKNFGEQLYINPQEYEPDITIIADSCYEFVQNCGKVVHVGHGILSKGQYYTDTDLARREESADLVCVPGEFHKKIMNKIITKPVVATGMAKLDGLFSENINRKWVLGKYKFPDDYKYILFAPTFNDELSAIPYALDRINEVIPDDKTFLLVKLHGSTKKEYMEMYRQLFKKDARVIYIDELDITPFMAVADIMISDVSSAMMEFAALDKPLILFNNPDWKKYKYYNPSDMEFKWRDIGIQVTNLEEMKKAVERSLVYPEEFKQKRKYYTDQILANKYSGNACAKIINAALELCSNRLNRELLLTEIK